MEESEWLQAFLEQRQLRIPDARPLYAYRCSLDEFRALQDLLSKACFAQISRTLRSGHCSCFCIYAAEWWKRNHEGGTWRWRDILAAIGWDEVQLPELYPIVQEGLVGYWRRELLTLWGKRAFLVTLACEGGLPLRLLHRQETKLRRYFHDLLQEFAVSGRSGLPPSELAARVSDRLPPSLQHDVVYELSGRLTSRIWQLQLEVGDSPTPVATLDRNRPGWRDSLPLVVEDDTARMLLNNLVEDASRIAFRRTAEFSLVRRLRQSGREWTLEAEIRWPSRIRGADLARMLAIRSESSLPSRLQLLLEDETRTSSLFALVTYLGTSEKEIPYVVEVPPRTSSLFRSFDAARGRRFSAVASGAELGHIEIGGGTELAELPWTFVESATDPEVLHYVGQGSVRTRHAILLVALNSSWELEEGSAGMCEQVGSIGAFERTLWRVSGSACFVDDDGNRCQIQSGAACEETAEFQLAGSIIPYGAPQTPLFAGIPSVYQRKPGGVMDAVDRNSIEWRPVGTRDGWQRLGPECLGDIALRVVSGGEVKYRARAQVLPDGAAVELSPGRSGRGGCVRLRGMGTTDVGVYPLDNVKLTLSRSESGVDIDVVVERGECPATLRCRLRWQGRQELTLEVPFPVRLGRYLARDGSVLKSNATICVDQLAGVVASVVDAEDDGKFSIEGRMHANDIDPEIAHALWVHAPLISLGGRRHELDLRVIQESLKSMMALTKDLDALCSLKIVSHSTNLSPRTLYVSRYDLSFELDRDLGEVRLDEKSLLSLRAEDFAQIRVEARPLWQGQAEPIALSPSGAGRWLFDPRARLSGPWLILAWDGSWCRARPTLWQVPGDGMEPEEGELAAAARVADPIARSKSYDELIASMANDPDHPEWHRFFAYLDGYDGVPKSALNLFDRLVDNPEAVALALLLATSDQFDKLWYAAEELPFSWTLVPVRSWVQSARRMVSSLESAKLPLDLVGSAFETFVSRAPRRLPAMGPVAQLMDRLVLQRESRGTVEPMLALKKEQRQACEGRLGTLRAELFRAQADDRWPPGPNLVEFRQLLGSVPKTLDKLWHEPPVGLGYQSALINAPIAAALASVCGTTLDRLRICELRRLRDFAPDYFDRTSAYALSWAVGLFLDSAPGMFG